MITDILELHKTVSRDDVVAEFKPDAPNLVATLARHKGSTDVVTTEVEG